MIDTFNFPREDIEYLDSNFQERWEMLEEGNGKYGLLIKGFPIPYGFSIETAYLMILVPISYPAAPLDMFYLDPPLTMTNGREIPAVVQESHFNRVWQRWSRHYDWQVGEDNLNRHIEYVKCELAQTSSQ